MLMSRRWWAGPRICRGKRAQEILEVDMEPLACSGTSFAGCDHHESGADAVAPLRPGDHSAWDEGVDASIPGDVGEPSQPRPAAGANPAQAVPFRLSLPVVVTGSMAEAFRVQGLDLGAGESLAPVVADHRATVGTAWTWWVAPDSRRSLLGAAQSSPFGRDTGGHNSDRPGDQIGGLVRVVEGDWQPADP
jgi:hypothetical protein